MPAPGPGGGPQVAYVDITGDGVRGPLDVLWDVRFELAAPVRSFGSFRGQRSFQGSWWFATTGAHVGFESWVERDHVMLLDFDPDVVGVSSQPFWLSWTGQDGAARRHAPDYFARCRDGSAVVIDVRPDERVGPDDEQVFAATAAACAGVGWGYRRVGAVDSVFAANVRWLAGYRHIRCLNPEFAARLLEQFCAATSLADAVARAGDRLAVLPTLFHLIWTGVLTADLRSGPLTSNTPLGRAGLRAA